ncbi:MAG: glycosyltransferase [Bacteroidales bacterium]|jgi:GT2 family glycosyltransferase|nr:glycosyltransferase [Bacteroidales bacterium]
MKLSIIIVNYNVVYFLDQCLASVYKALKNTGENSFNLTDKSEIFVVDNNSVDNSVEMIKSKYPDVILIENKHNVGFSKANNQAIKQSTGEYVLLLNPDTIVEEETFAKCISFMDKTEDCGGLGVKMIDGEGKILKESKRGFPTPWVSFCKLSGLIKLFPHSRKYAGYYMGNLSYDKINEVEVLAGAFMMLKRECLKKTGLLDEDYFMYGEDIDLSYRITKAGYKNYFFPNTQIIHYKGESTKKSSLNYVYTFYNAMQIFAQKHFSHKQSRLFSFIITLAIWLRASLDFIIRIFNSAFQPILDFTLSYICFLILKHYWAITLWHNANFYEISYSIYVIPCYIIVILGFVYIYGGYSKTAKVTKITSGVFFGMLTLLVFYSLLPASLRYSRALILMGSVMTLSVVIGSRLLVRKITTGKFSFGDKQTSRYLIIGEKNEAVRVAEFLRKTELQPEFIHLANITDIVENYYSPIKDMIRIYSINEIIFCAKSLSQTQIMNLMGILVKTNVHYTIAPENMDLIISSNQINTPIDLYTITLNSITQEDNRRKKRLFDIFCSLFLLMFSPIFIFIVKRPLHFIKNCVLVLFARKTFVGYGSSGNEENDLPKIKPSILTTGDFITGIAIDKQTIHRLNLLYARNYSIEKDFNILIKNIRSLGK